MRNLAGEGCDGADAPTCPGRCQTDCTCAPPPVKYVFLSSSESNGDLGGLSAADAICNGFASAASLPGTYKAWLSDSVNSPSTRFTHATIPYVLVNGTVVANSWSDLTDGSIAHKINLTEHGVDPNVACGGFCFVFTNTNNDGTPLGTTSNCSDWTSTASADTSVCGTSEDDNPGSPGWTAFQGCSCNGFYDRPIRLYCFEQ